MRNRVVFLAALIAVLVAPILIAQNSKEPQAAFEVASVKLFNPDAGPGRPGLFMNVGPGCSMTGLQIDPKRMAITAFPYTLISLAYGKNCQAPDLLTGGPDWIRSDRYDVEASMPEGTPVYTPIMLANRNAPQLQLMIRSLMEDRFKLKLHSEMKDMSAYVLTAAKGASKLTPASDSDQGVRRINLKRDEEGRTYGELIMGKGTLADLAGMVSGITKGQILDKSGVTGQFNLRVEYDNNGVVRPTIDAALQEQLGLKLEPTKIPTEILVIDSIARPVEN